ncbi:hypothetical protein [Streptomyces sp. NPDC005281]|uniref:hypothetical protein n=1 Tax=Streptomyces sp. NPDC005281 TaxID=3155712 RepID=UPI0033BF2739
MTDEVLKAQAIQDPAATQNLIAIENARAERDRQLAELNGANRLRMLALAGVIALMGLAIVVMGVVAGTAFVVDKAGRLKLSWRPVGTSILTVVGGGLSTAAVWALKAWSIRRRAARAIAENPPENRTEGDQNQVGAP